MGGAGPSCIGRFKCYDWPPVKHWEQLRMLVLPATMAVDAAQVNFFLLQVSVSLVCILLRGAGSGCCCLSQNQSGAGARRMTS